MIRPTRAHYQSASTRGWAHFSDLTRTRVCDNSGGNFYEPLPASTFVYPQTDKKNVAQTGTFGDKAMLKRSGLWCALFSACLLAAMLAACSRDPNVRKQKYLESGERYYEKGKYREAAIQYENAIQVDASFADAHY